MNGALRGSQILKKKRKKMDRVDAANGTSPVQRGFYLYMRQIGHLKLYNQSQ